MSSSNDGSWGEMLAGSISNDSNNDELAKADDQDQDHDGNFHYKKLKNQRRLVKAR
jgi:hypothetical protein